MVIITLFTLSTASTKDLYEVFSFEKEKDVQEAESTLRIDKKDVIFGPSVSDTHHYKLDTIYSGTTIRVYSKNGVEKSKHSFSMITLFKNQPTTIYLKLRKDEYFKVSKPVEMSYLMKKSHIKQLQMKEASKKREIERKKEEEMLRKKEEKRKEEERKEQERIKKEKEEILKQRQKELEEEKERIRKEREDELKELERQLELEYADILN